MLKKVWSGGVWLFLGLRIPVLTNFQVLRQKNGFNMLVAHVHFLIWES